MCSTVIMLIPPPIQVDPSILVAHSNAVKCTQMNELRTDNRRLRKAKGQDAGRLAACIDAAYAHYAARIAGLPPVSADCAEEIARYQVWIAEAGDDLVGGLVMIPEEGFMRLANIAVHPDHKGTGLGRALIALAEAEALDQGYRELRLTTHAEMPENVGLYKHLGWHEDRRQGSRVFMKKLVGD